MLFLFRSEHHQQTVLEERVMQSQIFGLLEKLRNLIKNIQAWPNLFSLQGQMLLFLPNVKVKYFTHLALLISSISVTKFFAGCG